MKKQKTDPRRGVRTALLIAIPILVILLVLAIWMIPLLEEASIPVIDPAQTTAPTAPTSPAVSQPGSTPPETDPAVEDFQGLKVLTVDSYAGIYMEDGSDEPVSDVMMLILENGTQEDLQLARINLEYADFTAHFQATNIPAGEKVVLLEQNRHSAVEDSYLTCTMENVLFFPQPMDLMADTLRIEGYRGSLKVTNISQEATGQTLYIYYKNSASDLLYGGITYRVKLEAGLAAGESKQVVAGHFDPQNSRILSVAPGA